MIKTTLNPLKYRSDFPILSSTMNDKPLIYLDNAATTQKPNCVIDKISEFYQTKCSTIHRGVYQLSQEATESCEKVRKQCAEFLNASSEREIVFVSGATEAINLVATSLSHNLKEGDEIIVGEIEHHANIVPWQNIANQKKLKLKVLPVNDAGEYCLDSFTDLLNSSTKIVAITHVSNVLGTITPVKKITQEAHKVGALVLIDGAQGAPHQSVDVQEIDCDFYCFSGHKVYGPTGIGVLYGKAKLLEEIPPYQLGGDMIESVSFEKTTYASYPAKFEAGTPPIAQIIGLGEAIRYIRNIGLDNIQAFETELLNIATQSLNLIDGLRIYGTSNNKSSLISFTVEGIHPHDLGTILDQDGIAVRVGHHCAQPTMKRFGIPATTRASFAFYNTEKEIEELVASICKAKEILT